LRALRFELTSGPRAHNLSAKERLPEETAPVGLIAGKYRLTRLLGRGGMGSVWEGVHATLGNRVACKFISPDYAECEEAVARFESEALAAASLRSKHIVDVYDHGVTEDGRPYIVMEYLVGETLEQRLKSLGTIPLQLMSMITRQVASGLARAHRAGIVHRDLKPENIVLVWDDDDETDVVKIVDFGIAKFTSPRSSGVSSSTIAGSVLGSPYYMSPEQARGLSDVDARADIWSLGVIVYEALTGDRPFEGEALGDLLVTLCTSDPEPPSKRNLSIPQSVDRWMKKALERDRDRRFQDVRQMAEALVACAGIPQYRSMDSLVGSVFSQTIVGNPPPPRQSSIPPVELDSSLLESSSGISLAAHAFALEALPLRKHRRLVMGAAGAFVALLFGLIVWSGDEESVEISAAPAPQSAPEHLHPSARKIDRDDESSKGSERSTSGLNQASNSKESSATRKFGSAFHQAALKSESTDREDAGKNGSVQKKPGLDSPARRPLPASEDIDVGY
jgi:serine/threonine protein kinase